MTRNDEPAIEVEVLEIDGAAPPPPTVAAATDEEIYQDDDSTGGHPWTNWQRWPAQARHLHPFWWPVLIIGGCALLALFLTAGLVLGVLFIIYRIVRNLFRAVF
jgi:hypothetical protein